MVDANVAAQSFEVCQSKHNVAASLCAAAVESCCEKFTEEAKSIGHNLAKKKY